VRGRRPPSTGRCRGGASCVHGQPPPPRGTVTAMTTFARILPTRLRGSLRPDPGVGGPSGAQPPEGPVDRRRPTGETFRRCPTSSSRSATRPWWSARRTASRRWSSSWRTERLFGTGSLDAGTLLGLGLVLMAVGGGVRLAAAAGLDAFPVPLVVGLAISA